MFGLLLLILPGLAGAEIYRWVEDGVVHYSDRPARDAEQIDLPELQRMAPVAVAEEEEAQAPAAAGPALRIEQPRPEQTFRDARGLVPAAVSLSADLTPGQRLVYYLDGRPVAEPTRQQRLQLEGVARGEHRLSVALVEGDEEIARSETVTFFMQPPSALGPTGEQGAGAPTAPASGSAGGAPAAPRPGGGGSP